MIYVSCNVLCSTAAVSPSYAKILNILCASLRIWESSKGVFPKSIVGQLRSQVQKAYFQQTFTNQAWSHKGAEGGFAPSDPICAPSVSICPPSNPETRSILTLMQTTTSVWLERSVRDGINYYSKLYFDVLLLFGWHWVRGQQAQRCSYLTSVQCFRPHNVYFRF